MKDAGKGSGLPSRATANDATTPDPGYYAWQYSTSTGRPQYWNGTKWTNALSDDDIGVSVPSLTATNTYTGNQVIQNASPRLNLYETGVAADTGNWSIIADSSELEIRALDDAFGVLKTPLTLYRTGNVWVGADLTVGSGVGFASAGNTRSGDWGNLYPDSDMWNETKYVSTDVFSISTAASDAGPSQQQLTISSAQTVSGAQADVLSPDFIMEPGAMYHVATWGEIGGTGEGRGRLYAKFYSDKDAATEIAASEILVLGDSTAGAMDSEFASTTPARRGGVVTAPATTKRGRLMFRKTDPTANGGSAPGRSATFSAPSVRPIPRLFNEGIGSPSRWWVNLRHVGTSLSANRSIIFDVGNADRTLTLDASGTLALKNVAQTFSALQTFSVNPVVSNSLPGLTLHETDGPTDEKLWKLIASAGNLTLRMFDDADTLSNTPLIISRIGYATVSFAFTGDTSITGALTASGVFTANGASVELASGSFLRVNGGSAAPTLTTRSAGTKLVLVDTVGSTTLDYALGIEGSTMWFSVGDTTRQWKWYASETAGPTIRTPMVLSGDGLLTVASASTTNGRGFVANAAIPVFRMIESDQAANATTWQWTVANKLARFQHTNDDLSGTVNHIQINRDTGEVRIAHEMSKPNIVLGGAALATTDTTGMVWVPTAPGAPSGAASAPVAGLAGMVVDSTNFRVYFRIGSAWKYAALI